MEGKRVDIEVVVMQMCPCTTARNYEEHRVDLVSRSLTDPPLPRDEGLRIAKSRKKRVGGPILKFRILHFAFKVLEPHTIHTQVKLQYLVCLRRDKPHNFVDYATKCICKFALEDRQHIICYTMVCEIIES